MRDFTNQWSEYKKKVESKAGAGGGEEDRNRMNRDDGGGDGDCDEQLDGDDGIDLSDERPSELRALQHHRVERRLSRLQIMLPHLSSRISIWESNPIRIRDYLINLGTTPKRRLRYLKLPDSPSN